MSEGGRVMVGLNSFYLFGAVILLVIALVYCGRNS